MDIFVARQPIFDRNMNVFAYELLYRSGSVNKYTGVNGDQATSDVIINSFLVIGIDKLTDGKPAFVNFTDQLLKTNVATLLPKDQVVIEILETVIPENDIVSKCQNLKELGYILALDDFIFNKDYIPLIKYTDIIKIDLLASGYKEARKILTEVPADKVKFLAEKVETEEAFKNALNSGYSYFQGYFFSKPHIIQSKDIPSHKKNYLELIDSIYQPNPEFEKMASLIERDVSLSIKILKLVNSASFYLRKNITSIKHALVLLGIEEIRKLISLVILKGISGDKPSELMKYALVRAKFCEGLALKSAYRDRKNELFLMGMFSMIDVMMNRPMEELLYDLPISMEIKDALIHKSGAFMDIYNLILCYEKGDWNNVSYYSKNLLISDNETALIYYNSLKWADSIGEI